jgi:hypothetical protein
VYGVSRREAGICLAGHCHESQGKQGLACHQDLGTLLAFILPAQKLGQGEEVLAIHFVRENEGYIFSLTNEDWEFWVGEVLVSAARSTRPGVKPTGSRDCHMQHN